MLLSLQQYGTLAHIFPGLRKSSWGWSRASDWLCSPPQPWRPRLVRLPVLVHNTEKASAITRFPVSAVWLFSLRMAKMTVQGVLALLSKVEPSVLTPPAMISLTRNVSTNIHLNDKMLLMSIWQQNLPRVKCNSSCSFQTPTKHSFRQASCPESFKSTLYPF